MTRSELTSQINWNDIGIGTCSLYVKLFERNIFFKFFSPEVKHPSISEKMFETLIDVLMIDRNNLTRIKDLLWEECIFSFHVTDYGCIPNSGETVLDANLREFGLSNKDDVYHQSELMSIHIDCESDDLVARYAEIQINSATNNLISIIVKNGEIIDFDDAGTFLKNFEDESTYARIKRDQILSK